MADYVCPHCGGSTWVIDANGDAQPCTCRDGRVKRAQTSGLLTTVPRRFAGATIAKEPAEMGGREFISDHGRELQFHPTVTRTIIAYCRNIDKNLDAGKGLWLQGDPGTGKTTAAMVVSKSALQAGRTVAIYSMPRLLAEIRSTFDANTKNSYEQLFAKLTAVDLLHIDDVGAEQQTEWVLEQLYAIVNARYEDGLAILVTTNLDADKLRDQIGDRTVSRLSQMCGDSLPFFGHDRRQDPFHSSDDEPTAGRIAPSQPFSAAADEV